MASDITKYYAFSALCNCLFFLPIVYIYYQSAAGLTFTEVFIVESIYSISIIVFEVTSGALADYFGRKISLITGSLIWVLSALLFSVSTNILMFIIGYVLWALGASLLSGADVALLYDILSKTGQKDKFKQYQGNANFIGLLTLSLISIASGFLINFFSMSFMFILSAIAFALMFVILITIKHIETLDKSHTSYVNIIRESASRIKKSELLIWLFVESALFMTVFKLIQPSTQFYMSQALLEIEYFGIASAYFFIMAAIGSRLAEKFNKIFRNNSYLAISILVLISLLPISLWLTKWGFVFFGFFFLAISINSVLIKNDILQEIPKEYHATIISFNNLADRLIFAIFSPLWGWGIQSLGLRWTFTICCLLLGISIPLFKLLSLKVRGKTQTIS